MTAVSPAEIGAHPFTRGMSAAGLERLAALAVGTEMPTGRRLFEEAGRATSLWLIRAGRVALDLRVTGRGRLIVETLGPGDELGLSWLSRPALWQFGAEAVSPVAAFQLSSAAVLALCEDDHEIGYQLTGRLLRTAISRLQAARIRILDLYAGPESGRGP